MNNLLFLYLKESFARMLFFNKKYNNVPKIEFSGVILENPIGLIDSYSGDKPYYMVNPRPSFITLTPPESDILKWVNRTQDIRKQAVLCVNLRKSIQKNFALLYDFVDFLIIDTSSDEGTADIPEISAMMDELLSLRLCYEHYTRVLIRISDGLNYDEIVPLLDYCRLSGIDGVVVNGEKKYNFVYEHTQGRLPIMVHTKSPQEALALCSKAIPVETELAPTQRKRILKSLNK